MNRSPFFADLLNTIADRGRMMLNLVRGDEPVSADSLARLCARLLSSQGEASGVAYAREILDRWRTLGADGRLAFLHVLRDRFGTDHVRLAAAVDAYRDAPDDRSALALHDAAEPARQELLRRLNLAPGGIETLVRMRQDLLARLTTSPDLAIVDADFAHLLSSWFNRGFLVLRRIDWSTPANILEKIIRYEAVHAIHTWDDLRRRIEPEDRLCYAFFHPQLGDEPLIFVEVALTRAMPTTIAELLADERPLVQPRQATTAVFYSISNCQEGLRGISFGNFLIKQVVEDLRRDLPGLTDFVTLSPVPGFARWLAEQAGPSATEARDLVANEGWHADAAARDRVGQVLLPLAAQYFLEARTASGKVIDPVARFHLGNGARLERIDHLGDLSPRALRQAHGLMVNYRYKLDDIEKNHELFAARNDVAAAPVVRRLLPKPARSAAPRLPAQPQGNEDKRDI
ncbi:MULTISPECIES: malonyl-CoA decarboxylase [unclassified Mesorhizobium]|uniref:malonyl-CoA decarboxylase n=1 Tax=unclassified Mesorhizobium TaxID=325217 RepID=UPI000FD60140|nr:MULTISPECIES: malonyl-CoA decarboxylase [unclassified Mesorhizobium]RVB77236.1 MCD, Malonyl-CoA decarboxylase MCD [Mesorhizobium sp. M6A.T.Cr.TU.014.01.1.1]RWQ05222.1 MAG: MCD, Malonyl-CoA decarboxylase MCD [Mesorhizobium sp.]RWQ10320.1 MAG: MCD, Malonyl-CoA decarboxylase MCD [Mesorhizobium sp.]